MELCREMIPSSLLSGRGKEWEKRGRAIGGGGKRKVEGTALLVGSSTAHDAITRAGTCDLPEFLTDVI